MADRPGLWRRLRRARAVARDDRSVPDSLRAYLQSWLAERTGVEAWVEPASGINKASLLLIAHDGEWTRRAVPSPQWARDFAAKLGVTSYDAGLVAYPQRMRDYDRRRAGATANKKEFR